MRSHLKRLRLAAESLKSSFIDDSFALFPWKSDLASYRVKPFLSDCQAAVNVALLGIPQGLAYAAIAEIPIVYGIASSAIAAIVAPFFCSSRYTILGPTNATAFMTYSFFAGNALLLARQETVLPILILMVGILCVLGALFKLAELLQYISRSVLVGYISGAAVLIIANQVKHLLGVEAGGRSFFSVLASIADALPQTQWQPLAIGGPTLALYLALQRFCPRWPNFAIVLVAASLVTQALSVTAPGLAFASLPRFDNFSFSELAPSIPGALSTSLLDDISSLAGIALAIAFIASLENTVMAKSLAARTGDSPDVNQDMLAVGAANVACSFIAPMPASGSLTRSALNASSGARSRFASLFSGLLCAAGLALLIVFPVMGYVPRTVLAALVIGIALSLFKKKTIRICLRSTHADAVVLITTFLASLFAPLHVAIFIGTALSILLFLKKASQPHLVEYAPDAGGDIRALAKTQTRPVPEISIVHVEGDLFFGAAELFRNQVQRATEDPNLKVIILRLKNARHLDATSVLALEELIKSARSRDKHVLISGANRNVFRVLRNSGLLAIINQGCNRAEGECNIFLFTPSNPNIATRNALKRAQQLLGGEKADIRIFVDPTRKKN